jgi:hypothetical protein
MKKNSQVSLTDKNLDCLSEFINHELKQPMLSAQIPNGAHLFYGSYNDPTLTHDNLRLVSKTLLGMTLGYVEDAPLVMIFESKDGKQKAIDLSDETEKTKFRSFIEKFQQQRQHEMAVKIYELVPA